MLYEPFLFILLFQSLVEGSLQIHFRYMLDCDLMRKIMNKHSLNREAVQKYFAYRRVGSLPTYRADVLEDNSNDSDLVIIYVLSYGVVLHE